MQKEKLWTKAFISTSIVNFVLMLSMYLLLVTMAGYAIEKYNSSPSIAGLVASIFIIGVLIGRLYVGKKIAQVGAKKILILGIFIFVVMSFLYFFHFGVIGLMIIRIIQGVGLGFATTATGTIVSQVIPSSRSGEGIGYFSMSVVLSTAIGPLIGIQMLNFYDYWSIFLFSSIVGIFSLILSLTLQPPAVQEAPVNKTFSFGALFEKNAIPISLSLLIMALGYAGILSFMTSYAEEINLVEAGGFFFLVYAVAVLATRPITGKLMDVKGANAVAYPGIILFAIGMLLLATATNSITFLLAAVLIGLGYGNFQSITQAIAVKVTPIERMGLANSTYFICLDFALGIGPLFLGLLEPFFGYRGMYLTLVGVIIIGLVVYYLAHGKKDKVLLGMTTENKL